MALFHVVTLNAAFVTLQGRLEVDHELFVPETVAQLLLSALNMFSDTCQSSVMNDLS